MSDLRLVVALLLDGMIIIMSSALINKTNNLPSWLFVIHIEARAENVSNLPSQPGAKHTIKQTIIITDGFVETIAQRLHHEDPSR